MDIDQKLQDAAKLAQEDKSWIWELIAGVLLALSLWSIQRQLDKTKAELAEARTALEHAEVDAHQSLVHARFQEMQYQAQGLEERAKAEMAAVLEQGRLIKEAEAQHAARVKTLQAVKAGDWDALNKLAGVKP